MHVIKNIFWVIFLFFCLYGNGQDIPVNKYKAKESLYTRSWNFFRDPGDKNQRVALMLAYNQINYLNKTYSQQLKSEQIVPGTGFTYGLRILLFKPFSLDINGIHNEYRIDNTNTSYDGSIVTINGIESSLNFQLLPSFKHLSPYLGLGYFTGRIASAPILKTGLQINISRGAFSLFGEYKQSLSPYRVKANNHISAGLLLNIALIGRMFD